VYLCTIAKVIPQNTQKTVRSSHQSTNPRMPFKTQLVGHVIVSLRLHCPNKARGKTFDMEMSFGRAIIFIQIKHMFALDKKTVYITS